MKSKLLLIAIAALSFLLPSCHQNHYHFIMGNTQGTTYHITYNYDANLKPKVDSILQVIDKTFSLWNTNSILYKVNHNQPVKLNDHFIKVFKVAMEISEKTNGAFDITVGPLVDAYGFGAGPRLKNLTQKQIDSLLQFVGYKKVHIVGRRLVKDDPRIKLDFNAIAQGYTVDVVAHYFDSLGISDYMIEIGGETLAKGRSELGGPWRVGVAKPVEGSVASHNSQKIVLILGLEGSPKAVATSGDYRKFYIENGVKFTHTVNPHTGLPARDSLISVSILAPNCTTADGYATACMVLGLKKAIKFVKSMPNLEAFFIYIDHLGRYKFYMTPGFKKYVIE